MIEKILHGDYLTKIDKIQQWEDCVTFFNEKVSTHSYKVTIFSQLLFDEIFGKTDENQPTLLKLKILILEHALYHDFDEVLFGRDIPHPIKYNSLNGDLIRNELEKLAQKLFFDNFHEDDNDITKKNFYQSIFPVWSYVHTFVKLADWMAMYYFCKRELKYNNESFTATLQYCKDNIIRVANEIVDSSYKDDKIFDYSIFSALNKEKLNHIISTL